MTDTQREMARHALGLPNKAKSSNRNFYCIGKGGDGYEDWESLVADGLAVKRETPHCGGDDLFHLTLRGALMVREPDEHRERRERESLEWLAT